VKFERALVVFAHPDDAEFGMGGTVAAWTRSGTEVTYVCVTDGSAGSNEPGAVREEIHQIRQREQLAACKVLGVDRCEFLGYVDGMVELTLDLRRDITGMVRRYRPQVLVAPDPSRFWDEDRTYVNHIDHRTVGEACMAVVNPDSSTRPMFPELLEQGLEPWEIPYLWIPAWDEDADTLVDISQTIDVKIEALRCHASQLGDWPVEEWMRTRAKERAAAAEFEYAEVFRTFRLREVAEPPDVEEA
jgi:LmbE family N-acetylglucosaminyl deacetylase